MNIAETETSNISALARFQLLVRQAMAISQWCLFLRMRSRKALAQDPIY